MAKGFKHGAGGPSLLNFKVVGGTTEPLILKENIIWIDTDSEITSWIFSAKEPTNFTEGMVWIFMSTTSSGIIEFNALKKNGIQIFPVSAKQYVGDAWVDKTVKIFQNGVWVDWWNGELYTPGNEWTNFTGGWVTRAHASITRTNDYLEQAVVGSGETYAWISTANPIDLTNVTRIEMDYSTTSNASHSGMFLQNGNPPSSGGMDWSKKIAKVYDANTGGLGNYRTLTLDTSAIKGSYLVYRISYGKSRFKRVRMYY